MQIENLSSHRDLIPLLAQWHYRQWGDLTGAQTEAGYRSLLSRRGTIEKLPLTLIAIDRGRLLGSVNIVACDMDIRPKLTPWLAQLYVHPPERRRGVGSALVREAVAQGREIGFDRLYLYTSGTLPSFYERIGWATREAVLYKGKDRTVMEIRLPK
jgi:GNAT superfamily N-acetyltransferase